MEFVAFDEMWRNGTFTHCWWEHEMVQLLENSVAAWGTGKGRTLQ